MKKKLIWGFVLAVGIGVSTGGIFSLLAFQHSPPAKADSVLTIPLTDFSAFNNEDLVQLHHGSSIGNVDGSAIRLHAPVLLPHKHKIKKLVFYCYDAHSTSDVNLKLMATEKYGTSGLRVPSELVTIESSGTSGYIRALEANVYLPTSPGSPAAKKHPTVSQDELYWLEVYLPPGHSQWHSMKLYGVKIYYGKK